MNWRKIVPRGLLSLAVLLSGSALAQWTEKWPVNVKITPDNAVSEFLRAHFGKLGEIAAGRLDHILYDPAMQAKMAPGAVRFLRELHGEPSKSESTKSRQFLAAIEDDIGPYIGPPVGELGVSPAFAGALSVIRLTWNRQKERLQCQKQNCVCPDGSRVPFFTSTCYTYQYINGQLQPWMVPPRCTTTTDTVDVESEYKVYRNDQLLATFGEQRKVASGQVLSVSDLFFGFFDVRLSAILPPSRVDSTATAGPFYDFDAYNLPMGTPLRYRVVAARNGCGPGYTNEFVGFSRKETAFHIDQDGDSFPDLYPRADLIRKRTDIDIPNSWRVIPPGTSY